MDEASRHRKGTRHSLSCVDHPIGARDQADVGVVPGGKNRGGLGLLTRRNTVGTSYELDPGWYGSPALEHLGNISQGLALLQPDQLRLMQLLAMVDQLNRHCSGRHTVRRLKAVVAGSHGNGGRFGAGILRHRSFLGLVPVGGTAREKGSDGQACAESRSLMHESSCECDMRGAKMQGVGEKR